MAWDDLKVDGPTGNDILAADYNDGVTDQKTRAIRTTGAGAPSTAPANIGDIYIDTTNSKFYMAMGTGSAADWKKVIISS